MKVQQINYQQNTNRNNNQQPSFNGLADSAVQFLRFLDTNQAWGATAVDFSCMVAPRTITDFTRGPEAGVETMRREASGTVNHASVGLVYGPLAGMLLATALNSKYGIKAQKVFADAETVDMFAKPWHEVIHAANVEESAVKNGLSDNLLKAYTDKVAGMLHKVDKVSEKETLTALSDGAKSNFSDILMKAIKNPSKENRAMLRNIVLSDFGKEKGLKLVYGSKSVVADLDDIIANSVSTSKALNSENVIKSFIKSIKFEDVNFVKSLKKFGMNRSLLGLGIASAIGCCIQPFNIYLTKKKTGSDGFVGVEGREKDNSGKFKGLKAGVAAVFGTGVYSLITNGSFRFADFLKNIQYKGITPTLNQFKLVYGLTIMSRFLAARDKDELREATVKDTLGYLSWLVFGNFVSKGALKALDKNLVGKTRDEVLYEALKKAKISTVENGKALSFKELLKKLPKSDKAARKSLRFLTLAQLAGYAFSGIVLGVGIPKLNIYMTKKSEQKRAAARAMNPENIMLKPENIAFLSSQMNFTSNKMLNK